MNVNYKCSSNIKTVEMRNNYSNVTNTPHALIGCKRCGVQIYAEAVLMHEIICGKSQRCVLCGNINLPNHYSIYHICGVCGDNNVSNLDVHMKVHTCDICDKVVDDVTAHKQIHYCRFCNDYFDLDTHIIIHTCLYCKLADNHTESQCNEFNILVRSCIAAKGCSGKEAFDIISKQFL